MIERIFFVLLLGVIGVAAYYLYTRHQIRLATKQITADSLLDINPDQATLVYFTTPFCAPCKLQQTPNLERLQDEMGDGLHIIRIDATEEPHVAEKWGVISVPTTFVLDHKGQPRKVHNGVVGVDTLRQDIENL